MLLLAWAAFVVKKKDWGPVIIIGLLFISMFRAESVGIDTTNYFHEGFSQYASGMRTYEYIYYFLTTFMNAKGSYLLIAAFSIVTFVALYFASLRFSVKPVMAFFFFVLFEYFSLSMNIARQYTAAAILLLAYSYLFEKGIKHLLFFVYLFIAFGFHSSSIGFLLIYPFRYINIGNNKFKIGISLGIIFMLLHTVLREYYLNFAHSVMVLDELEVYARYFDQAENSRLSLGGTIMEALKLILNVFVLFSLLGDKTEKGRIVINLFFASIIVDMFFSGLYGNIGRLRYSINIINIIAYSYYFIKDKKTLSNPVAYAIFLIFGYELIFSMAGAEHAFGTVPYKMNFWLL